MLLICHYYLTLLCLQRQKSIINNLSCHQLLGYHMSSVFSDPSFYMLLLILNWTNSAGSMWRLRRQFSCAGNTERMICYLLEIFKRRLSICSSESKRQLHRYRENFWWGFPFHLGEQQSKLQEEKKKSFLKLG